MGKLKYFIFAFLIVYLFTGCASLNGNVPFNYQPSLLSASKTIAKDVGVKLLEDIRPEKDAAYTKSIQDISEKITAKIIDDFEKSRLFEDVHFSHKVTDDLIIEGTINRFKWKMHAHPIAYIPYVNFIAFFGIPIQTAYGIADISLTIKDAQSGRILGTFQADSTVIEPYSLYNVKQGEAGAELAEAFRAVVKDLKEQISQKIQ